MVRFGGMPVLAPHSPNGARRPSCPRSRPASRDTWGLGAGCCPWAGWPWRNGRLGVQGLMPFVAPSHPQRPTPAITPPSRPASRDTWVSFRSGWSQCRPRAGWPWLDAGMGVQGPMSSAAPHGARRPSLPQADQLRATRASGGARLERNRLTDDGDRELIMMTWSFVLRTTFRAWCDEAPAGIRERCLAQESRSPTVRTYSRTDFLERRRVVMQRWADFVTDK